MATHEPKPTVSGRWLVAAFGVMIAAAAVCAWATLCILFWQGTWQLLYHPTSAVTRTPASINLPFDPVGFAGTAAGDPRLTGWWIPAAKDGPPVPYGGRTILYLHSQNGNLGGTVDALAALHAFGVNILAFDYGGYGQSKFQHPSEANWREDAESALRYLTETRQVPSSSIVLYGKDLGANLALEIAAQHPELAGVVLESPLESPADIIFNDPRARLVPARLLVRDRFDTMAPAAALQISSLWFFQLPASGQTPPEKPASFQKVASYKMLIWLEPSDPNKDFAASMTRWLDDLHPIS